MEPKLVMWNTPELIFLLTYQSRSVSCGGWSFSLKSNMKIVSRIICQLNVLVQFSSVAQSCLTLCNPMNCRTLGVPVQNQLPEPTQTHVHWVGGAIQPSHPLLSTSPPALNLSQHQVFSNESALHIRWPKYCSFSISISPSNSGLISFRMDWLDLLAVQETLKSLLLHHSS